MRYRDMSAAQIAELIKRTPQTVGHRIRKLELRPTVPHRLGHNGHPALYSAETVKRVVEYIGYMGHRKG